jgi:hypothetical protein
MYTIKKGRHYSGFRFPKFHWEQKTLKKSVKFTDSCIYDHGDDDQLDVNKLFGLSFGFHHKNSIRFGWRWDTKYDMIQLYGYTYLNGSRIIEPITYLLLNKNYVLGIEVCDTCYHLTVYDCDDYNSFGGRKKFSTTMLKGDIPKWGYHLYPYFGGNKVAPHNIYLYMDDEE